MAAANEVSLGAATVTDLPELDGIFTVKEYFKKTALKAFSQWAACFHFDPDRLWQEFNQTPRHVAASHRVMTQLCLPLRQQEASNCHLPSSASPCECSFLCARLI